MVSGAAVIISIFSPPSFGIQIKGHIYLAGLKNAATFQQIGTLANLHILRGTFAGVGIILGAFAFRFALQKGYAGWGIALCTGIVLPTVIFSVFVGTVSVIGVMSFFGTLGGIYAYCMWLGLRGHKPDLFVFQATNEN